MGLVAPPAPRPRRLFRSPKAKGRLTWAGQALERHGATIIVVARFVPGGRTATTFTAGTVRLSWPRFAAADAVGATLWAFYAAGLGYLGGETFERRPLSAFLFGLGVALLVALVVEAARRLQRRVLGWRSGRAWRAVGAMRGNPGMVTKGSWNGTAIRRLGRRCPSRSRRCRTWRG